MEKLTSPIKEQVEIRAEMIPNFGREENSRLGWFFKSRRLQRRQWPSFTKTAKQAIPNGRFSGTRAALGKQALGRKYSWDYNGGPANLKYLFNDQHK